MTHDPMTVSLTRLGETLARLWPASDAGLTGDGMARLQTDSRRLAPGDVFVAVPGVDGDGRDFIAAALAAGAAAVLCHAGDRRPCPE